ncbi:MAG: hypothetical protein ABIN95_12035 [Mucilaginibacter sp.]
MKQHFELRRVRDFGEIISDSFVFFKDNFKELFKPLIIICGFFIVSSSIAYVFMQINIMRITNQGYRDPASPDYTETSAAVGMFTGMGFYYINVMLLALCILLVTFCYMAVYQEKKGLEKPTMEEVWGYFKYYFFRSMGGCILMLIMVIIGTVLCVFPGMYLATVFYLILPIMIIENSSFSYALSKSFKLISGNWWLTFGVMFVMSLVVGFASSIASIPVALITSFKQFISFGAFTTPLLIFFSVLMHILMLGYALLSISIALCYFSYSEQKEGTGLMSRIERLGTNDDDTTHLPTEQY